MELKRQEPNTSRGELPTSPQPESPSLLPEYSSPPSKGDASNQGPNYGSISPIDSSSFDLVIAEEGLWAQLATLRASPPSLEVRTGLRDAYVGLSHHYAALGGLPVAARFLRNAIAEADDPELRHQLARLEGHSGDLEFINSYTQLLKTSPYDLKLTLEFCYFLERQGIHEAALNILRAELQKKLRNPVGAEPGDAEVIDSFFALMQAQVSATSLVILEDYRRLLMESFPEELTQSLQYATQVPEQAITGLELEEFSPKHGLKEEVKRIYGLVSFFTAHYAIPSAIVGVIAALILMAIFRTPPHVLEFVGTSLAALLLLAMGFDLLRSLRVPKSARVQAFSRIAVNLMLACLSMMILNWLGGMIFAGDENFFSVWMLRFMSVALVGGLLWRAYLAMASIRDLLREIGAELMNRLTRRSFRRQLADLVEGTAKWTLILHYVLALQMLSRAKPLTAVFAGAQLLFLAISWWWGRLEARAQKQRLRDELVFVMSAVFSGLLVMEWYLDFTAWEMIVSLSLDATILLAVAVTLALQITAIGRATIWWVAGIFCFLNFAPVLDEIFGNFDVNGSFDKLLLASHVFEVVVLLVIGLIVISRRSIVRQEVYMDSKYSISAGNIGAVGDGASAANIVQTAAHSVDLDLSVLARDLASLQPQMLELARTPEHFEALAAAKAAENAAKEGDKSGALSHLSKVGAWFWDNATKIGVGVGIAAAKSALGL